MPVGAFVYRFVVFAGLLSAAWGLLAASEADTWLGPKSGPAIQPDQRIVFIAEDLRNGGVLGVAQGVKEAAKAAGWRLELLDAGGARDTRTAMVRQALAKTPDGLILGGMDVRALMNDLPEFASVRVPVVAWHGGEEIGAITGTPVAVNVTTSPDAVARAAAREAITQSGGRAGVVIFTDSRFAIAMKKARVMAEVIRACAECALLEVSDVAISSSVAETPGAVGRMLQQYGRRWTHTLAINDIYFDHATPVFAVAGLSPLGDMSCISAGDGSAGAYMRIMAGTFQTATVPEPLNLQGWQLIDELNRLITRQPWSGYVEPVYVVTQDNVLANGGEHSLYDPENGYRQAYSRIWYP